MVSQRTSDQNRRAWWANVWATAVEGGVFTDTSQLDSGRSLARRGRVGPMEVEPGGATATPAPEASGRVGGGAMKWSAHIGVRMLSDGEWVSLIDAVALRPALSAQIVTGIVPVELYAIAHDVACPLGLGAHDLVADCTCPDWHEPCRHVFALGTQLAERIEEDPWLYLLLRGMDRQRFTDALRAQRTVRGGSSPGDLSHEPRGLDPGLSAAAAHRRTADAPPRRQRTPTGTGAPARLGAAPPLDSGVELADLQRLVADASRRALELLTQSGSSGLALDVRSDVARVAASALVANPDDRSTSLSWIASRMGADADALERDAVAWRVGGAPGVAVASDAGPISSSDVARGLAGSAAIAGTGTGPVRVNGNRLTVATGDLQLRVDERGEWWRFRRDERLGWLLDDGPFDDVVDAWS